MTNGTTDARNNNDCAYRRLVETVRTLRGPGGCPWDAEQTHESLRPNMLEECYEALEAMDTGDSAALKEELGDLLIQIVFHADIAERSGEFNAADICNATNDKLRRRHAHVFGDAEAIHAAEDVVDRWERIKREEAGGVRSIVASVPRELPAVALAAILIRRASRAGLDLTDYTDAADNPCELTEESAGKMLMSHVAAVQAEGIDAESALRTASLGLRERILHAEALAGETALADLDEQERARIWEMAATDGGKEVGVAGAE